MADFDKWIAKIEQEYAKNEFHFAEIFQHLHQYPEIGGNEINTAKYLLQQITSHTSLEKLFQVNHGFLIGYKETKKPALCLRGDLDALAIEEKTKLPYISQNRGVMHACGHDFHATAVYAVALLWDKLIGVFPHSPVFMFQHAEEPIPGGALDFIKANAQDYFSEIFGLHVEPGLQTGDISLVSGWVNAKSIKFDVEIMGRGGHSARPWDSEDPLKISIDIIQKLYSDLPRKADIQQPFVFTVTRINTDNNAYNVVPKKVQWGGTLRVTDEKIGNDLIEEIKSLIGSICHTSKMEYTFNSVSGAPPVYNAAASVETADSLKQFLLEKNWTFREFRSLGGEDFGWFSKIRPGFFLRIGITPPDHEPIPLHSSQFKLDFQALKSLVIFYSLYFLYRSGLVEDLKKN